MEETLKKVVGYLPEDIIQLIADYTDGTYFDAKKRFKELDSVMDRTIPKAITKLIIQFEEDLYYGDLNWVFKQFQPAQFRKHTPGKVEYCSLCTEMRTSAYMCTRGVMVTQPNAVYQQLLKPRFYANALTCVFEGGSMYTIKVDKAGRSTMSFHILNDAVALRYGRWELDVEIDKTFLMRFLGC